MTSPAGFCLELNGDRGKLTYNKSTYTKTRALTAVMPRVRLKSVANCALLVLFGGIFILHQGITNSTALQPLRQRLYQTEEAAEEQEQSSRRPAFIYPYAYYDQSRGHVKLLSIHRCDEAFVAQYKFSLVDLDDKNAYTFVRNVTEESLLHECPIPTMPCDMGSN